MQPLPRIPPIFTIMAMGVTITRIPGTQPSHGTYGQLAMSHSGHVESDVMSYVGMGVGGSAGSGGAGYE
jgi:hypothetical protein